MANETFKDIEKLESDLWEAADHLRANSKLRRRQEITFTTLCATREAAY
ncbi:MAG: hypothetical protein ACREXX_22955 [Gammaproteobacteria bacterium]